ncbi:conserved uncharacterized protein [Erwinia billingiae Eb661]|uniref:Conserved uncharacterized protein n=1 Tax=Erwinia billingiae (strain Eb661) TaxID=634500 RepID=D8MMM8_ERWBE|nr:DUF262 domain-containing protein [Erwinia billingiae]CAX58085.1 conserved uncharacterized protein [Erwinia billingiae Eb661]
MEIQVELKEAKREIVKDSFDMSIGELTRIYERDELIINPVYQRLFRWDESQKTRFIESILLGIPLPPIFVFTDENGRWEVIDGLQRLSTIFEFVGCLKKDDTIAPAFIPSGTHLLPSLDGMSWSDNDDARKTMPLAVKLDFERSRLRVEILKKESDEKTKYELFERLNTGGSILTEQEVRNCVMIMLNKELFDLFTLLSEHPEFKQITLQTEKSISEQKPLELTLRFLAYRYSPFDKSTDINEWLNTISRAIASDPDYNIERESAIFKRTFDLLARKVGTDAFKKFDGQVFSRGFLISAYEVITHGVSKNIDVLESVDDGYLVEKIKELWSNDGFTKYARAGVSGPTRLVNTLPNAEVWMR